MSAGHNGSGSLLKSLEEETLGGMPVCMKIHAVFASVKPLAIFASLALTGCSPQKAHLEKFEDLPGLLGAMQAFSRDVTNQGRPVPNSVSLGELVSRGYISSNSVRAFEGMETKVWPTANLRNPNCVLMSAEMSDGTVTAALADGSVQSYSVKDFAEHLKKTGQQDRPAGTPPLP